MATSPHTKCQCRRIVRLRPISTARLGSWTFLSINGAREKKFQSSAKSRRWRFTGRCDRPPCYPWRPLAVKRHGWPPIPQFSGLCNRCTCMEASLRLKRLLYPSRGDTTELRFDGLSATVPDNERFNLCRELVLQRVYEVAGVPTGTVLDCGANVGMFTLTAFRSADRVVAVEPDPSNYHLLAQNVANSGARNIRAT